MGFVAVPMLPIPDALDPAQLVAVRTLKAPERQKFISSQIDAMGGSGELAFAMIQDWYKSPYLSLLRWAVSAATGQNVHEELDRVQERSNRIFREDAQARREEFRLFCDLHREREFFTEVHSMKSQGEAMEALESRSYSTTFYDTAVEHIDKIFGGYERHVEELSTMRERAADAQSPQIVKTVQVMAALSQCLESPTVRLYRGICCGQGHDVYELAKAHRDEEISVPTDQATSFSGDYYMASNFAEGIGFGEYLVAGPRKSVVLMLYGPAACIVASPKIFPRLENEHEYIVATNGAVGLMGRNVIPV